MAKTLFPQVIMELHQNSALCSICTYNYFPYASLLNKSLQSSNKGLKHYILVVDANEKDRSLISNPNYILLTLSDLKIPKINELIDRYDPFELSNVLKPFFFEWLIKNKKIKLLVYLDTDIYVYNSFNKILQDFKDDKFASIGLTTHISNGDYYFKENKYIKEELFLKSGLFNGGFYILKNDENTLSFLKWHKEKLRLYGFNSPEDCMFVDQRILDLAPILFKNVKIIKDIGCNIGHWNFEDYKISEKADTVYIEDQKLIFFHFSQLNISTKEPKIFSLYNIKVKNKVINKLIGNYLSELKQEKLDEYRKIPYRLKRSNVNSLNNNKKHDEISELVNLKKELIETNKKLNYLQEERNIFESNLRIIYYSKGWRILQKIYKLKSILRKFVNIAKKINKEMNSLKINVRLFKYKYFSKKRFININSNKIVYIGHSYHTKTSSTRFLIKLLSEQFNVEEISDNSWKGESYPDLSLYDRSYRALLLFQNLPTPSELKKTKNENIIFFPMFDAYGGFPREFWMNYINIKFINFSSHLNSKLIKWGLQSMYIQYFPKPQISEKNNKTLKAFFWQRTNKIDINVIEKLVGKNNVKLHIHKAVDPGFIFCQPTIEQEKKFDITYSDWFENKEDILKIIKESDIFFAPRDFEGIGMSFLDAMSMGTVVVAPNNPTMNEYIIHNETGILYDLNNIREINLSNLVNIKKNLNIYMINGYKEWKKCRSRIIDYVNKS